MASRPAGLARARVAVGLRTRLSGGAIGPAVVLLIAACSTPHAPAGRSAAERPSESPASARTVLADWDDTEAAVLVGAEAIEAVIEREVEVSPTLRRYELRLNSGETAVIEIARASAPPEGLTAAALEPPVELRLAASVGLAGDAPREQRLMRAVARRLEQLRGVDAAPIR